MISKETISLDVNELRQITKNAKVNNIYNYLRKKVDYANKEYLNTITVDANKIPGIVTYWSEVAQVLTENGYHYKVNLDIAYPDGSSSVTNKTTTSTNNSSESTLYDFLYQTCVDKAIEGKDTFELWEYDIPDYQHISQSMMKSVLTKLKTEDVSYTSRKIAKKNPHTGEEKEWIKYTFDIKAATCVAVGYNTLLSMAMDALNSNKESVTISDINNIPNLNNQQYRQKIVDKLKKRGISVEFSGGSMNSNTTKSMTLSFKKTYELTIWWDPPSAGKDPANYTLADKDAVKRQENIDSAFASAFKNIKSAVTNAAHKGEDSYLYSLPTDFVTYPEALSELRAKIESNNVKTEYSTDPKKKNQLTIKW